MIVCTCKFIIIHVRDILWTRVRGCLNNNNDSQHKFVIRSDATALIGCVEVVGCWTHYSGVIISLIKICYYRVEGNTKLKQKYIFNLPIAIICDMWNYILDRRTNKSSLPQLNIHISIHSYCIILCIWRYYNM